MNPLILLRPWISMLKCSRLESRSETSSQNNNFLRQNCFKAQVLFMPHGRCSSASHPCFCNGWGVNYISSDTLWSPQAVKRMMHQWQEWLGIHPSSLATDGNRDMCRTGKPMNGNFKTQMFHPSQDHCHSIPTPMGSAHFLYWIYLFPLDLPGKWLTLWWWN